MSWLKGRAGKDSPLQQALAKGEPQGIEAALLASAPARCETLEQMAALIDDAEQVKTLRYWQRARWGHGGQTQALSEMRRVFKMGPKWRRGPERPSKLPPLYPE